MTFDGVAAPASESELRDLVGQIQAATAGMTTREVVYAIDLDGAAKVEVGVPPAANAAEEAENGAIIEEAGLVAELFAAEIDVAGRMQIEEAGAELILEDSSIVVEQAGFGDGPPRGGRHVAIDLGCTIGFYMRTSGGNDRMTTAGHCGDLNDSVTMLSSGEAVGTVSRDEPSGHDVLSFTLPASYDDRAVVTVRNDGSFRKVVGQRNAAQQQSGDDYCFTGLGIWNNEGTEEKCGDYHKIVFNGTIEEHCVERQGYEGDSGGPMYALDSQFRAIAVGTNTRILTVTNFPFPVDRFICFQLIDQILNAFNYTLATEK